MRVWHFFRNDGTTGEGRLPVRVGETMRVDGKIIPCQRGLHGSVRAIDALKYAPGSMVQIAELGGTIVPEGDPIDKYAASERTCIAIADAPDTLHYFARWCALSVIDKWDAPQVVLDWLGTGDNKYRSAARYAAWSAAESAAWPAARYAARSAAESTAESTAESAAWSAARSAAMSAVRSAAESTAESAAWSAALSAALSKQNKELERLLQELFA